jgi:hypothetical protein
MKACTRKQRQWLWFAGLWCAGLIAAWVLATLTRWIVAIA